jgi:RNAse (barnase) inhibitor barstar
MTREPGEDLPVVFRIDGRKIKSANDFYREIGSSVNGPGGYFGRNLDALADCLRGGFGTPDNRPYEFEWQHSAVSRQYLNDVRHGRRTLFEAIQDVFRDAGVPLNLK